jgi:hypothetical protein
VLTVVAAAVLQPRRKVIQDRHAQGLSNAQIAQAAGLSRERIHQIRHTGPTPGGAFLGTGAVTSLPHCAATTPPAASSSRLTGHRPEPAGPDRDLRVHGCRPQCAAYYTDPVIRWEHSTGGWALLDTATGHL